MGETISTCASTAQSKEDQSLSLGDTTEGGMDLFQQAPGEVRHGFLCGCFSVSVPASPFSKESIPIYPRTLATDLMTRVCFM